MYGAIQLLVTLKRGVCMGLFYLLLPIREGRMYLAIQPLATLKSAACIRSFNPLLHLRGAHV